MSGAIRGWARAGLFLAGLAGGLVLAGCDADGTFFPGGDPAPPRALDGYYYNRAVHLSWELHPQWNGESFRVYGKRTTDADFFYIAEVTNCVGGRCAYTDMNVAAGRSYEYYVSAFDAGSGVETASDHAVEIHVPQPTPPPVPGEIDAVPLDGAVYLTWNTRSRDADDFAFYRVYLEGGDGEVVFLGETDSEGFLDLLVQNGNTYGYFVTAVDDLGHESEGSVLAEGTPRPDFHGEFLYAYEDRPSLAGFRFQESEATDPIVAGDDPERHFRLEVDEEGWWLVPGPGVQAHVEAIFTTQLRCGPAADAGCVDVRVAPASDYAANAIGLAAGYSYVLRTPAAGGGWRYGVVRVSHTGFAHDGAIILFDWAYQLQVDNRALAPSG